MDHPTHKMSPAISSLLQVDALTLISGINGAFRWPGWSCTRCAMSHGAVILGVLGNGTTQRMGHAAVRPDNGILNIAD